MKISMVAAIGKNRVLAANNSIPWNIEADSKHWRSIVHNKPVLMGSKTYEQLGLLEESDNFVLSRNLDFNIPKAKVVHSVEEALQIFNKRDEEVFIIGGGRIYESFIKHASKLYLTYVDQSVDNGSAYFPEFETSFKEVSRDCYDGDPSFCFVELKRAELKNDL